jgi:RecA-family ATPase
MLRSCLDSGVDAIMGPFSTHPGAGEKILKCQDKLGRKLIIIDTPVINVDDNQAARDEVKAILKRSRDLGCAFCLIHHSSAPLAASASTRLMRTSRFRCPKR